MNGEGHPHTHTRTSSTTVTQGHTIRWAHSYDLLVRLLMLGREKSLRDEMIRQATIPANATVLDVGCGTGTLAILAKAHVGDLGRVYGIDAAPEMIEVARQKAVRQKRDVDFQQGVIEALPFPEGMFDVVLSSLMFHHLPGDLKRQGLAEIHRVLKPGGHLFIVDMQRPTGFAERLQMRLLLHAGLTQGIQDLPPLMKKTGYLDIQSGSLSWGLLGFVRAQRAA